MSVSEQVAPHLPYLRRFARAVTGNQGRGDACVAAMLEALVVDDTILPRTLPPRVAVYRAFLTTLGALALDEPSLDPGHPGIDAASRNLAALTPPARLAFLLVAVEEFTPRQAAAILGVSEAEVQTSIDEAGRDIARQMATDVVIIEDEPLIALDLERLVTDLGHRVVKIARTERQAVDATLQTRPGLVLADIHLADGSSGLDAVNEILRTFSVPVIFVTAYPQRLLTGTRPEPTFLIAKPFHHDTVRAVISQALFFDIRGRPATPRMAAPEA
ncbi:MAG: response regulator [Hyphomicrobiaceae bacterium]|nr:response regulator [Hyphomicrobiaceae bacterium]